MGPPLELAKAMWATEEQPETSPSPGPSDLGGPLDKCPHFPNRDAKAFTTKQQKGEHCRNKISNNNKYR